MVVSECILDEKIFGISSTSTAADHNQLYLSECQVLRAPIIPCARLSLFDARLPSIV